MSSPEINLGRGEIRPRGIPTRMVQTIGEKWGQFQQMHHDLNSHSDTLDKGRRDRYPNIIQIVDSSLGKLIGLGEVALFKQLYKNRFPMHVAESSQGGRPLTWEEKVAIVHVAGCDWGHEKWYLDGENLITAAIATSRGAVLFHGFGNFCAVSTIPDKESVVNVNQAKGRPLNQVGSLTTTREHFRDLVDERRLPEGLEWAKVQEIMDDFYGGQYGGPFGFRFPAHPSIPGHLVSLAPDGRGDTIRTAQLIYQGYRCPSNVLYEEVLKRTKDPYLFITSANRSHHVTGNSEEPAHYRMSGIIKDFNDPALRRHGFLYVGHRFEDDVTAGYPHHEPKSVTILSLVNVDNKDGNPTLTIERNGSLPLKRVNEVLGKYGFRAELGAKALSSLPVRQYQE